MKAAYAITVTTFALLLVTPLGSADTARAASEDCAAPCGYINPIIDLVFPEKLDCGTGNVLGAEASPTDCMTPPTADQPLEMDGTLRWYWDVSYDGTYPSDPSQPIEISFGKTSTHPSWIDFGIEPSTFQIDNTVLFDPQNFKTEEKADGSLAVFFWFEQPITLTFTRTGDPTPEDVESMQNKDGVQSVFVKVKSTASGSQYKEAYGIELFRFHGDNDPVVAPMISEDRSIPSPAILSVLGALGLAGLLRRRLG